MTIFHVAKKGAHGNAGTKEAPFSTINQAAKVAAAGDTVIVHEGIYRESVNPINTGISNQRRITYQAADGESVIIKGSERITNWEKIKGTVWKAVISNTLFGHYNPYEEEVNGDWVWLYQNPIVHTGDVYLDGQSFYEATSKEALYEACERLEVHDFMINETVAEPYPERTKYQWLAEVTESETVIYANFHEYDPRESFVEINVRPTCFYPEQVGINYITVKGFEMCQAATPWTPPSADQPGLIGPHWSKGWIIEDNHIHNAKCSAISLGKEISTGHNFYTKRLDKPGYQYQQESVFAAHKVGWSKEKIGAHIVRRNHIHDCGQNGIVGHLGCVFSQIQDNHIHDIALKREFGGWEIGGIKLHAPIDVVIEHNHIHHCVLGTWLDWQTQGTRITRNLFYENSRDFFVEVSHGPYVIDHNFFLSERAVDSFSQGGAFVNNLIAGACKFEDVLERSTPYHLPHSTDVKGCAIIYGYDDRLYNNLFINSTGTAEFHSHPASLEEYVQQVQASGMGDFEIFVNAKQPVYLDGNAYLKGSSFAEREQRQFVALDFDPNIQLSFQNGHVDLSITLPDNFTDFKNKVHHTGTLPRVRIADADFEDVNGNDLYLNRDYHGDIEENEAIAGPIHNLKSGENKVQLW